MRYVVVGLHAAGRSACGWLRRLCPDADIAGVDPNPLPPYARPLISHVLAGEIEPGLLNLKETDYFEHLGVRLQTERAARLDSERRRLILESGRELAYDRLLIATGASPRKVAATGALAGEIAYFRSRSDLDRLQSRIQPGGLAVVLGGGLVGFKLTMGLLARGMQVRLLVSSQRPMSLNVDEHLGDMIAKRLAATEGLSLQTEATVVTVEPGRKRRYALTLADDSLIEADLVAAGKGVVPQTDWLEGSGLDLAEGVFAGSYLQTSLPGVYAAGDAARVQDLARGSPQVNAIWPMAVEQGRFAAWNMAGTPVPYPGAMAMNSIPMFGGLMVSVGAVNPAFTAGCETLTVEPGKGSYLKLVFRENRLVGAVGFNGPPRLGELAYAVRRGLTRDCLPGTWLSNPVNAAPLAGVTSGIRANATL